MKIPMLLNYKKSHLNPSSLNRLKMIYIEKSQPAPKCLETKKNKTNGDYKCGNVLERIKNDFNNKCYICEYKEPETINIEHFRPHKGDIISDNGRAT